MSQLLLLLRRSKPKLRNFQGSRDATDSLMMNGQGVCMQRTHIRPLVFIEEKCKISLQDLLHH